MRDVRCHKKNLDAVSTAPARSTRCSSLFDKVPSRSRECHLVNSSAGAGSTNKGLAHAKPQRRVGSLPIRLK